MRARSEAFDDAVRVLLVEDMPEFRELLAGPLRAEGFLVEEAADGEAAVDLARSFGPDVILLDLVLPKIDGMEVCRQVRSFTDAYILMMTARDDEVDKVVGLTIGADDYVTKPVSAREIIARIRAMLRRPREATATGARRFGDLELDPQAREVRLGGELVPLTRLEFDLLDILSANPRMAFSRAKLLDRVWGPGWYGDDHIIDVHISNLRRKLGDPPSSPRYVQTVRGVGYRMGEGA